MSSTSVEQRRPFTFPRRPLLTLTALLREMSTALASSKRPLNPLYRWIDGVAATLNLRACLPTSMCCRWSVTLSTTRPRAAQRCPRILDTERMIHHDHLLCPDPCRPCPSAWLGLRTPRRAPQWPRRLFARWSPPPPARRSCGRTCDRSVEREPRQLHFRPSLRWARGWPCARSRLRP